MHLWSGPDPRSVLKISLYVIRDMVNIVIVMTNVRVFVKLLPKRCRESKQLLIKSSADITLAHSHPDQKIKEAKCSFYKIFIMKKTKIPLAYNLSHPSCESVMNLCGSQ